MNKANRKLIKLQLGKEYFVWFNYKTKYKCRFIQPTNFGFNFLNLETNKCLLKRHLYPSKYENHSSGDWFFINEQLKIEEKQNQDLKENNCKICNNYKLIEVIVMGSDSDFVECPYCNKK